jgi:hypothetical protein
LWVIVGRRGTWSTLDGQDNFRRHLRRECVQADLSGTDVWRGVVLDSEALDALG